MSLGVQFSTIGQQEMHRLLTGFQQGALGEALTSSPKERKTFQNRAVESPPEPGMPTIRHPNVPGSGDYCVIQLTEEEMRRGWNLDKVLKAFSSSRVRVIDRGIAVVR